MTEPRDQHDAVQDQELRRLFADATADLRPQGSLDDILDRTKKVDPMTRRWFLPVVAAAAVIGLAIGSAVWLANDSSSPQGGHGPSGTPVSTPPVRTVSEAKVYFAGASTAKGGHSLFVETQLLENVTNEPLSAVRVTVAGTADDPDYSSLWPAGITVRDVTLSGGASPEITVELAGPATQAAGLTPESAALAINAVVRTAQDAYGTHAGVTFADENGPLAQVLGVDANQPFQAGSDDTYLAPVQITRPETGDKVTAGDLTVEGVAATFEANVVWELRVGGDVVVKQGHTTAAECCTLAPYAFTIAGVQPGSYTLVVHDEDMSGEGRAVNQDTKEIVVE